MDASTQTQITTNEFAFGEIYRLIHNIHDRQLDAIADIEVISSNTWVVRAFMKKVYNFFAAMGTMTTDSGDVFCSLCQETHSSDHPGIVRLPCGHNFCRSMLTKWARENNRFTCPVCRDHF